MAKKKATKISVEGLSVTVNNMGYLSLTDIAKRRNENKPSVTIQSWLRNQGTISYLSAWEEAHNPNFKVSDLAHFRNLAEDKTRAIRPKMYIEQTGAVGITASSGRYGGTFAHSDIALEFCRWMNPRLSVFLNKEFQRLKAEEQLRLGDPFNIKRHLTSGNYSLLVSALLSQTDERLLTHPQPYKKRLPLASESDMLNKIVFGNTAREWRLHNADKPSNRNQRDYANVLDLVILNNLEFLDSMLVRWELEKEERKNILQESYNFQYPVLKQSKTIRRLQELADSMNEE